MQIKHILLFLVALFVVALAGATLVMMHKRTPPVTMLASEPLVSATTTPVVAEVEKREESTVFTDPKGYYSFVMLAGSHMSTSTGGGWIVSGPPATAGGPYTGSVFIDTLQFPKGVSNFQELVDAQMDAMKMKRETLLRGETVDGVVSLHVAEDEPELGQRVLIIPIEGGVIMLTDIAYKKGGPFDQVVASMKILKRSTNNAYLEKIAPPPPPPSPVSVKINGESVPPEPDATQNSATLAGIDANKNGVRDDVERILAKKFGGTSDYRDALRYARAFQVRLVAPTPKTREAALIAEGKELCATEGISRAVSSYPMGTIIVNTPLRKTAMRAFNDVLIAFDGEELPPCTP